MLKIGVTTFIMMLTVARTEPPVSSYLPPKTGTSGANGDLSTQYRTPHFDNGDSVNRNAGAISFDGSSSNGPLKLYGTPDENGLDRFRGNGFRNGQSSNSYNAPNGGIGRPSSTYGIPSANGNHGGNFGNYGNGGTSSTNHNVPGGYENNRNSFRNGGNREKPSTSYGAPDINRNNEGDFGNGKSSNGYNILGVNGNNFGSTNGRTSYHNGNNGGKQSKGENGRINEINKLSATGGRLSSSYDRQENGNNNGYPSGHPNRNGAANGYTSGGLNRDVGNFRNVDGSFRNGGGGYNDNAQEENTEPSKYEFSYEVKDDQSGNNYGHMETRDGDRAQGEFNILLPDGRKQIVEYEADQDGFKPQIRYEGEANTGGYDNSKSNDGYSYADNSGFNGGDNNNDGYPIVGSSKGKSGGLNGGNGIDQSGRPEGQFFGRNNNGGLSRDIPRYFSNAPNNNIDDIFKKGNGNEDVENNRHNGDNGGYQY